MDERFYVFLTAGVIAGYFVLQLARKRFDPFAPVWMFLLGYFQVYVVQAISYNDYGLRVRGVEVVTEANTRSLWAVCWFIFVYSLPLGRFLAGKGPSAPANWSPGLITWISPILVAWGLMGAFMLQHDSSKEGMEMSQEMFLLMQFPMMMLSAAILLIVTGREVSRPKPMLAYIGLAVGMMYVMIWMFNGKRSHSLFGVLTTTCAWYCSRGKRPSLPILGGVALAGAIVLTLAIGWRNNPKYERSPAGFLVYLTDFNPADILVNVNVVEREVAKPNDKRFMSRETEEWGGYLLMLDTVPMKSSFDYGSSYLRIFSTFIPRIVWPDKPYYGREEWVNAWIAGSEFKRDKTFTGPAIGILGALHLNGGATATTIVLAALALLLRGTYEYFLRYRTSPWAQAWWAMTFYNAWLMTVNDDPFVWFYYIYGFTILPLMGSLWIFNKLSRPATPAFSTSYYGDPSSYYPPPGEWSDGQLTHPAL